MHRLILSVSTVTAALANVSSVFQLFSFPVVCSGVISKWFGFVAFFASVEASSVSIRLFCLICLRSVVRSVCKFYIMISFKNYYTVISLQTCVALPLKGNKWFWALKTWMANILNEQILDAGPGYILLLKYDHLQGCV